MVAIFLTARLAAPEVARLAAPEVADLGLRPREQRALRGKMMVANKNRTTDIENSKPLISFADF